MIIKEEISLPQAGNPARDQGQRPTCIAFALSELNLPYAPTIEALSPEYVYQAAANLTPNWAPGAGVRLGVALQAASSGQPIEADFPYQATEPAAPVPAPPAGFSLYGTALGVLPRDLESIAEAIRRQLPVGLAIKLTKSFYVPRDGVIAFEPESVPNVLHAVTVVGLGWNEGTPYFRIRNSWGDGWGMRGQAWLSGDYIREHAICAFGG
ncbi:peptidase C1 [Lysobacter soli]|uniref:Peptidase C1 n=1 Tax=Lysobacter soli TaxID=453783 RepID=A0A3D8VBM0_9GAMM|nr:C1 family peptidase [Lysobacter soli]RDY66713.1 peptidase C1 [Lysobacter soli]